MTAPSIPKERLRRVLVVKLSSIGDVIHALPTVAALRRGFPESFLAWMVEEEAAGIVTGNPHVDETIVLPRRRWRKELGERSRRRKVLQEMWQFLKTLRAREFDLVVDLQGLFKSAIPVLLSGAPYRVGFSRGRELSPLFLTDRIEVDNGAMHSVDRYLEIPRYLGVPAGGKDFTIAITEKEEGAVTRLLAGNGSFSGGIRVVLNAPARWESKRWPPENFARLGDRLARELKVQVILTGGTTDRPLVEGIASRMATRPLMLAGKTSLKELGALLKRVALVISCDSGPLHLAAAMGTPTLALFGPTDPMRTGPYGEGHRILQAKLDCTPCFRRRCSLNRCLSEITVEETFRQAEQMLHLGGRV